MQPTCRADRRPVGATRSTGIVWLPRLAAKVRAHDAGTLGTYLLGQSPVDDEFLRTAQLSYADFIAIVRAAPDDAGVLAAIGAASPGAIERLRLWSIEMPVRRGAVLARARSRRRLQPPGLAQRAGGAGQRIARADDRGGAESAAAQSMTDPEVVRRRLRRRLPSRAERRVTFGLKVLALIALAIYLLLQALNFFGAIRTTGLLIVGALFLAYLIYPLVRRLNVHVPVIWSIIIVYAFIALILTFGVTLVAPQIGSDLNNFGHAFPGLMTRFQQELVTPHTPLLARVPVEDRMYLANLPSQFDALAQQYGLDTLQKGLPVLLSAASIGAALVIIPILAAYMLIDASNVRRQVLGLFPEKRRRKVHTIIDELDARDRRLHSRSADRRRDRGRDDLRDAAGDARALRALDRRSRPVC